MTELEAQRLLNEIRYDNPSFVRGKYRYMVRRDGRVEQWLSVGKSGMRWKSDGIKTGDEWWLPKEVRERAECERRHWQKRATR